jgi:hypothetical protein
MICLEEGLRYSTPSVQQRMPQLSSNSNVSVLCFNFVKMNETLFEWREYLKYTLHLLPPRVEEWFDSNLFFFFFETKIY